MENIYVIKVKTKPSLSSLYPSERRYSASTVGGLSFVHFVIGALSFFLGTLALSLQGPILSVACLCPFAAGLLAWKRWYIDRNITIFFYANLVSLVIAILCSVATIFDVIAVSQTGRTTLWSHSDFLPRRDGIRINSSAIFSSREESSGEVAGIYQGKDVETMTLNVNAPEEIFRTSEDHFETSTSMDFEGFKDFDRSSLNDDNAEAESSVDYVIRNPERKSSNFTVDFSGKNIQDEEVDFEEEFIKVRDVPLRLEDDRLKSFLQPATRDLIVAKNEDTQKNETEERSLKDEELLYYLRDDYRRSSHTKILLTINVLIAALLEVFWSLLSAKIALRGMQNRLVETSYDNNAVTALKTSGKTMQKKRAPVPKPDILDHDQRFTENLQHVESIQNIQGLGPRLPLPESNKEFRERVERFLANQAAHRLVEGSSV